MIKTNKRQVTYVPSNGKSHRVVHVTGAELRNGTREREPGSHLAEALHHGKDGDAGEGIS